MNNTENITLDDFKKIVDAGADKTFEDIFDLMKDIATLSESISNLTTDKKAQVAIARLGIVIQVNAFGEDMLSAFIGNGKGIEKAIEGAKKE